MIRKYPVTSEVKMAGKLQFVYFKPVGQQSSCTEWVDFHMILLIVKGKKRMPDDCLN